ncbi:MATE family efflux transporter [Histidinibacterium aquaticum]|uniref:MATE family efflux transporter n=1 Tax=Histidinibacterium aquaticum TaxID=2613962 RepID=A0A5J5GBX0_9RHOB|nr:MATE family efflux transporter [Histidinibacterium aquaticum]KAA9005646.1 MATE family efflux transporter [Histidinibacterium aquaticum]
MSQPTRDLTRGAVWRAIAAVSAPMTIGIFAVLSVGLADAFFLGRLGRDPLAAVGYIFPVITAITSLSIGLSAGTNAAVSQAIGRKESEDAEHRLALHAVGLGTTLSILVALAVWWSFPALFRLLGASEAVAVEIAEYMPWWALSFPLLVTLMQIQAVFRAHGKGGWAAGIMTVSALMNVGMDPILIFGLGPIPALGTEGAGLATFLARVAAVCGAVALAVWSGLLRVRSRPFLELWFSIKTIAHVGAPAAVSNAINPAGMAAVTAAVSVVGETAVAGFGAATRVQSMALVPLMALSAGIGPVVGQNWGAERQDRAARGLWLCFSWCALYGLGVGALLFLFATPIAAAIANGSDAAEFGAQYLRWVGWSLFGYGMVVTGNAAMNARDKAVWSLGLSLSRIAVIYLPLAWAGVTLFGYPGIVGAAVAANVLGGAGAAFATWKTGLLRLPSRARSTAAQAA